jgi:hypothetical protein
MIDKNTLSNFVNFVRRQKCIVPEDLINISFKKIVDKTIIDV